VTPENRFRERRSAFSEEDEAAPDSSQKDPEPESGIVGPDGEAVRDEPAPPPPPGGKPRTGRGPEADLDALDDIDLPPPSFQEIVEPLAVRALQFLGEMPLTEGGEKKAVPQLAKHMIDLIGILEDRTKGNLQDDEKRYIDRVLTDLRTRYLGVSS